MSQMEFFAKSKARYESERAEAAIRRAQLESAMQPAPNRLTDEEAARKEEEDLQGKRVVDRSGDGMALLDGPSSLLLTPFHFRLPILPHNSRHPPIARQRRARGSCCASSSSSSSTPRDLRIVGPRASTSASSSC